MVKYIRRRNRERSIKNLDKIVEEVLENTPLMQWPTIELYNLLTLEIWRNLRDTQRYRGL